MVFFEKEFCDASKFVLAPVLATQNRTKNPRVKRPVLKMRKTKHGS